MLTYLLALVVGLSSFALYMSAFFYPELYRKGDLAWSGVGLFYALVLWFSAERITGGVLLGQIAGVSLLGWLGWQALNARWGQTSLDQQAGIQTGLEKIISPEQRHKITVQLNQQAGKVKAWGQALWNTSAKTPDAPSDSYQPLKPEDFGRPPVTIETLVAPDLAPDSATETPHLTAEIAAPPPSTTPEIAPAVREPVKPANAIGDIFKSVTSIFNKPPKNTSTYVRKSVKEQAEEALAATQGAVNEAVDSLTDAASEAKAAVTDALDTGKEAMTDIVKEGSARVTDVVAAGKATVADVLETGKEAIAATPPAAETTLTNAPDAVKEAIATAPSVPLEQTAPDLPAAIAETPASPGASVDQVTAVGTDQPADAPSTTEDAVENWLDRPDDRTP
jgi:Ycf66 protein N-terminus